MYSWKFLQEKSLAKVCILTQMKMSQESLNVLHLQGKPCLCNIHTYKVVELHKLIEALVNQMAR